MKKSGNRRADIGESLFEIVIIVLVIGVIAASMIPKLIPENSNMETLRIKADKVFHEISGVVLTANIDHGKLVLTNSAHSLRSLCQHTFIIDYYNNSLGWNSVYKFSPGCKAEWVGQYYAAN